MLYGQCELRSVLTELAILFFLRLPPEFHAFLAAAESMGWTVTVRAVVLPVRFEVAAVTSNQLPRRRSSRSVVEG